mmetsp:Transcript_21985/g.39919  ORF Transcript_21985/g.39919 Transcript_21985/m.39919 type:complete len:241 (+) Transcript_21985:777-1499(+)
MCWVIIGFGKCLFGAGIVRYTQSFLHNVIGAKYSIILGVQGHQVWNVFSVRHRKVIQATISFFFKRMVACVAFRAPRTSFRATSKVLCTKRIIVCIVNYRRIAFYILNSTSTSSNCTFFFQFSCASHVGHSQEPRRYLLVRLVHQFHEGWSNADRSSIQHCHGITFGTCSTRTTNTMNKGIHVPWSIHLYDKPNPTHIQSSCCHIRRHQNLYLASPKGFQRFVSFRLLFIARNYSYRNSA